MSNQDETNDIVLEFVDTAAIVRFNRPSQRNSLSLATITQLNFYLTEITARSDIAAIVFTGTGDSFASGADIRELAKLSPQSAKLFAERGQRVFQRIADAKQLTIAAINGYCMGGGMDLTLACDIRVASANAVFSHPGARLGIITGWGGTQRLPRLIGSTRALELFMTARRFDAEEALQIGLVTLIGDPVLACALNVSRLSQTASDA